ncbi:DUF1134 domain-containing protein [Methyloligella sp. 2.7D]|uniref:DUF1134 domain-containing protein n=1 Tax=unclassified Methyloligella TaxID=2625955 RepID=UPI00157C8632|nr:DUF1134 domain-containing protein [Methyloligella sp. GL2]QKP76917.1 DUF1134 domain-containing protein [Methyloligella sp. GL2]
MQIRSPAIAVLTFLLAAGWAAAPHAEPQRSLQLAQTDITPRAQRIPQQERGYNQPYANGQNGQYGGTAPNGGQYGTPQQNNGQYGNQQYGNENYDGPGEPYKPYSGPDPYAPLPEPEGDGFSVDEITDAGHRFFGNVSRDLAKVIEYAFQKRGRPNGYILGEEVGGAIVAGLRYGEGTLYTRDAGNHKVFWQGPSVGYDFGAEGSKTMVLVYDLRDPNQIYQNYSGVDGSAYFIGGVGITYLVNDNITLAPIRSGVGLRLGANLGYLKFTRQPTWNPF